jgi:uncharacterized damage-inducible protein DinB
MSTEAGEADAIAAEIAAQFRRRIQGEYLPRIRKCVSLLDPEQLWRRPGSHNNSVANLLLHLAGNTRQWIIAGIGASPDHRDRSGEFSARAESATATGAELLDRLADTVEEAASIVDGLDARGLMAIRRFQSKWDETCLAAVLHVIEHFSGHAGQIYAYTKQTLDIDLRFYDL